MIKIALIVILIVLALAILWVLLVLVLARAAARALYPWRDDRRSCPPPPADPYSRPFGEMMPLLSGSLRELHSIPGRELEQITRRSAGRAAPAEQGSGGYGNTSQGAAAAHTHRGRDRRAR